MPKSKPTKRVPVVKARHPGIGALSATPTHVPEPRDPVLVTTGPRAGQPSKRQPKTPAELGFPPVSTIDAWELEKLEEFMNRKTIALIFGMHPMVVSEAIAVGELPALTFGTGRWVTREDVITWVRARSSSPSRHLPCINPDYDVMKTRQRFMVWLHEEPGRVPWPDNISKYLRRQRAEAARNLETPYTDETAAKPEDNSPWYLT